MARKLLATIGGGLAAAVNWYIEAQVRYQERLFRDLTDGGEGAEGMAVECFRYWDGFCL
jgi:hypothetical protein